MRTLSPLPWLCTVATTLPPLRNGEPILTLSPCPTSSTLSNSTFAPASAVSFSTRRTDPSLTRYCLPPVEITAYMKPALRTGRGTPARKGRAVYGQRGSLATARRTGRPKLRHAAIFRGFQGLRSVHRVQRRRKEVTGQRAPS